MLIPRILAVIALGAAALASAPAGAAVIKPLPDIPVVTEQVAGGCGPGRWRGPWGHCRDTPYYAGCRAAGISRRPTRSSAARRDIGTARGVTAVTHLTMAACRAAAGSSLLKSSHCGKPAADKAISCHKRGDCFGALRASR